MKSIKSSVIVLLLASIAPAIETTELSLRNGGTNDGLVTISRDADGNLFFEDAFTASTSLQTLAANPTDHGSLTGLDDDDHPQYLTSTRHTAAHDSVYNGNLPIAGDVNGNATLGAHVADDAIHPNIADDLSLTGTWHFINGLAAQSGGILLGTSQYSSAPALRFADSPDDAELSYSVAENSVSLNRPLMIDTIHVGASLDGRDSLGSPAAELLGFTSIEGIAATDLLSSTRAESISENWTFLNGISVSTVTTDGIPRTQLIVENGGASDIYMGDVVQWSGISSTHLKVTKTSGLLDISIPFAGIAASTASEGETLTIVTTGVAELTLGATVAMGDRLIWNGSGGTAFDGSTSSVTFAIALESGSDPDSVSVFVQWTSHDLP